MNERDLSSEFFLDPGEVLSRGFNGNSETARALKAMSVGCKGCQCVSCHNSGCNK